MGDFNTQCPNCGRDNAFHNGICFECPDCDYEWGGDDDDYDDDDDDCCPECGSTDLRVWDKGRYYLIRCGDCGYQWKE